MQLGVFEQVVHHHVGIGVTLQSDDQVGFATSRVVIHVSNAVEAVVVNEFLDATRDCRTARLIRQFGDNDSHLPSLAFFNRHLGTHLDAAATGLVGLGQTVSTQDQPTGGKVGALHELHQILHGGIRVFHQMQRGVDDFTQVVRRNTGCHTDGNAL